MDIQDYFIAKAREIRYYNKPKEETLDFEKNHPDIINQWFGLVLGFDTYSEGICGTNYLGKMVLKDKDNGFSLKSDVRKTLLQNEVRVGKTIHIKQGKLMNGFTRTKGWDILVVEKLPEMVKWMAENYDNHRFSYSGWLTSTPFFPK